MAFKDTSMEFKNTSLENGLDTACGVPLVSIVGSGFCAPYPVELSVKMKSRGFFNSSYEALDVNGNLLLRVSGSFRNLQKRRVVRDATGFPLLTLREKVLTPRHKWTVHCGESKERDALLFTVQRSSSTQVKQFRHEAFLASNFTKDVPNFQVVETRVYKSYRVYKGDTLIAEVNFELTWGGFWKGKRDFRLKAYPGVDYAFLVALVVIINENDLALV